jgi:hypothetical protein
MEETNPDKKPIIGLEGPLITGQVGVKSKHDGGRVLTRSHEISSHGMPNDRYRDVLSLAQGAQSDATRTLFSPFFNSPLRRPMSNCLHSIQLSSPVSLTRK